jgi:phosphoribosylformylglycinamidine synthase
MPKYTAEVRIELKKGVADPEGENTKKALVLLGFKTVKKVRTIKIFELEIEDTKKDFVLSEINTMCTRLLANPVIHTYRITIKKKS